MERQFALDDAIFGDLVVKQKSVAIAAEEEGHLQHLRITKAQLHTITKRVLIVLGLDDRDWHVESMKQDTVSTLVLGLRV